MLDSAGEYMYVPSGGTSNISKINLETGEIAWVSGTGTGPYGANLNPDETEIWVADKGNGRVVRDQGGFHGGIDPYRGLMLDY